MNQKTADLLEQRMRQRLHDELLERARAGLAHKGEATTASVAEPEARNRRSPASAVQSLQSEAQTDPFVEKIAQIAAQALKLPPDRFDPRERMSRYGVDSIIVTEIMRHISDLLDTPIAPTVFFEARHVLELAEILRKRYAPAAAKAEQKLSQTAVDGAVHMAPEDKEITADDLDLGRWAEQFQQSWQATGSVSKLHKSVPIQTSRRAKSGSAPVAIIGMAGQFAQSKDLRDFESNLRQEKDCMSEVPASRWDWQSVYGDPRKGELTQVKYGGFTPDVDLFDAQYFGISPREARMMDPQHRLFLQCVWQTIESAGYAPGSLAGKSVGLFLGINLQDYAHLIDREGDIEAMHLTSLGHMFCPNRISFLLDLHGPSQVIDTACSSSLVALHRAVMSIRHEGCEMAIAGGANLMLSSDMHVMYSKVGMICEDGRCKTFSDQANGYARGDGVGAVLLKRLDLAEQDGDPILAVIRGSAENHGGASASLTAPNPNAQAALIVQAHEDAGVDPRTIGYVECHGTGTALGDPIEVNGLKLAFETLTSRYGLDPLPEGQCALGSVKSNIGHAETAAGIAGVIKTVLSLRHQYRYRTLHCETLNPLLELEGSPFHVLQQAQPWPAPVIEGEVHLRCAGVSSFGAGGSNAHIVLEEYLPETELQNRDGESELILLSARDVDRLNALVDRWLAFLPASVAAGEVCLADVAYTLQVGRDAMDERLALLVSSLDELQQALLAWREGRSTATPIWQARAASQSLPEVNADFDQWLVERSWSPLAQAWVRGQEIDWAKVTRPSRVRRVCLPTYPFAPKRFWFKQQTEISPYLHPLIHRVVGNRDGGLYQSTFTGTEPFFVDHLVDGVRTLPAAAYLEMIRVAWRDFLGPGLPADHDQVNCLLTDVVWPAPLRVTSADAVDVTLRFSSLGADRFRVQIHSGNQLLHCQGYLLSTRADTLQAQRPPVGQPTRVWTAQQCYDIFDKVGLRFGLTHQQLKSLSIVEINHRLHVLAALDESATKANSVGRLDAGLQATLGFALAHASGLLDESVAALPFSVARVEFYRPVDEAITVWVREASDQTDGQALRFDMDWFDPQGNRCLSLRGFSPKSIRANRSIEASPVVVLAQSDWHPAAISDPHPSAQPIRCCPLLVGRQLPLIDWPQGDGHDTLLLTGDPVLDYENLTTALLQKAQQLASQAPQTAQVFMPLILLLDDLHDPLTGIDGMLRAFHREAPRLMTPLFVMPALCSGAEVYARVQTELARPSLDPTVAWRDGQRHVRRWKPMPLSQRDDTLVPLRHQGVYLLAGGSGQLARHWMKRLDHDVPTSRCFVLSRHEPIQMPPNATWIAGDVSVFEDVQAAVAIALQAYGRIDGVLHMAGELGDAAFTTKRPEDVRRILAPKVAGVVNLDRATGQLALDFFVMFSSLSGAFGGAGQVDYAAANGFLDAFAQSRHRSVEQGLRQGLSLSIAWPYWEEGGMQMAVQAQRLMARHTGMLPLPTEKGLATFACLLGCLEGQTGVLYGVQDAVSKHIEQQNHGYTVLTAAAEWPDARADLQPVLKDADVSDVQRWLVEQVAALLQYDASDVQIDTDFGDFGFDSISFTEFSNVLSDQLELALGPTLFFEYSTIRGLADWFIQSHPNAIAKIVKPETIGQPALTDQPSPPMPLLATDALGLEDKVPAATVQEESTLPLPKTLASRNPVCIVGMSGSFPGASNLDQFWESLARGDDQITPMPSGRWPDGLWESLLQPGDEDFAHLLGGYIDGIDLFDARFFKISPTEAQSMDPQQRLLLVHAVKALEDAGQPLSSVWGSNTGVFIGTAPSGYAELLAASGKQIDSHSSTGNVGSLAPNRISYFLNLHGPSEPIETACSSSLVAVHRAVQAIMQGDCDQALVGGAQLLLSPHTQISFGRAHMLSPDGRCHTFSSDANGYVRGEAVGVLFLKRFEQALADRNPIYGVIYGTAENHGGKANSLTAPNPNAQKAVILKAHERAGVDVRSVGFVEAHGTGTALGDPIEISALKSAFLALGKELGIEAFAAGTCAVGSVKTQIGHTELAAGIAGLIKLLLQLKHRTIAPNLHGHPVNSQLDISDTPFFFPQAATPWDPPTNEAGEVLERIGCVSSFGYGGVNAHVVIGERPDGHRRQLKKTSDDSPSAEIMVVSARTREHLTQSLEALRRYLCQHHSSKISGPEPIELPQRAELKRALAKQLCLLTEEIGDADDLLDLDVSREDRQAWHACLADLYPGLSIRAFMHAMSIAELETLLIESNQSSKDRFQVTQSDASPRLCDIAYTLQMGRDEYDYRFAAVVRDLPELVQVLERATRDLDQQSGWFTGQSKSSDVRLPELPYGSKMHEHLEELAKTWVNGASVKWQEAFPDHGGVLCSLPGYPMQPKRYWFDIPSSQVKVGGLSQPDMPRTGFQIRRLSDDEFVLELLGNEPFLTDHVVNGQKMLPGVSYLSIFHQIARLLWPETAKPLSGLLIEDLIWLQPIVVTDSIELAIRLEDIHSSSVTCSILSKQTDSANKALLHAKARLSMDGPRDTELWPTEVVTSIQTGQTVDIANLYQQYAAAGLHFGRSHQTLQSLYASDLGVWAHIASQSPSGLRLPPGTLDAAVQALAALASTDPSATQNSSLYVPFAVDRVRIFGDCPDRFQCVIRVAGQTSALRKFDLLLADENNAVFMQFTGFAARELMPQAPSASIQNTTFPSVNSGESVPADRAQVVDRFKVLVAEVLGYEMQDIDPHEDLEAYGIDSMSIMQLTERLQAFFGAISKTLFYEFRTLSDAIDYFVQHHPSALADFVGQPQQKVGQTAATVADTPPKAAAPVQAHPRQLVLAQAGEDDIAIIGVSGRYPRSPDLHAFWSNLRDGVDCIDEVPADRWRWQDYYSQDRSAEGKHFCKWGGFIDEVDCFDPLFFNFSPSICIYLDPQERLFLEHSWQAIEDAGYTRESMAEVNRKARDGIDMPGQVGVYAGVMYGEYQLLTQAATAAGHMQPVGNFYASIANRVSYWLNLHGPSMAIDTMCSSSLTAIHLACQDLRLGNIDMALAGGVNLNLHPNKYGVLSVGQYISSQGRCEAFGADGSGYVPGEGVGCVVLKRLSDAERDGDQIYGVIKASVLNHGGKTNGYSVPNPQAQRALVRRAMYDASIDVRTINYVEAHGTGTKLGDPIEISGLTQAFADQSRGTDKCFVGSVKSNIGHSEAAAGVAALTKVLMQLRHQKLVPSLHSETLNPHIRFEDTPFEVNQVLRDWPAPVIEGIHYPRAAGISSYGAGGSNAHLVVQEYVPIKPRNGSGSWGHRPYIFVLSARTRERLKVYAQRWIEHLRQPHRDFSLLDACYTGQVGREGMTERFAVLVRDHAMLLENLEAYVDGQPVGWQGRKGPKAGLDPISLSIEADHWPSQLEQWCQGKDVDWQALYERLDVTPKRVSIPTYPFEREVYRLPDMPKPAGEHLSVTDEAVPVQRVAEPSQTALLANPVWLRAPEALPPANIERLGSRIVISLQQPIGGFKGENWVLRATHLGAERWIEFSRQLLVRLQEQILQNGAQPCLLQLATVNDEIGRSSLWAFLRSVHLEYPHLRIQWLEYLLQSEDGLVIALDQLSQSSVAHLRIDQQGRWVRHWNALPLEAGHDVIWRESATYLILGGTGGIGAFLAREILTTTKSSGVILVGSSAPDSERVSSILSSLGVSGSQTRVQYLQSNLANPAAVTELIRSIHTQSIIAQCGPLAGIVQSAGTLRDAGLMRKKPDDLDIVMKLKMLGTEALLSSVAHLDLDFVVLFGSIAGVTGNVGQVDYAAANAYLDEVATHYHKAHHLPVKVVDWPYWAEGGMRLSDAHVHAMRQATGLEPLSLQTGRQALVQALRSPSPQTLVLSGCEQRIRETVFALLNQDQATSQAPNSVPASRSTALQASIQERLTSLVAELGQLPVHRIEPDIPLSQYGFDSVAFMRLVTDLEKWVGQPLPQTLFFECPTILAATDYLVSLSVQPGDPPAGQLDVLLTQVPDVEVIKQQLIQLVAKLSQLPEHKVESDVALSQYGFDSVAFLKLTTQIESLIQQPLGNTLFFEHPTIDQVAAHLAQTGLWTPQPSSLVATVAETSIPVSLAQPVQERDTRPDASTQPEITMTSRAHGASSKRAQEIAIIGMEGQFPGADDVNAFWENLVKGVDAITEVPRDRWSVEQWFDPNRRLGKTYCKWGGFINDVDQFDASFFRLSLADAALIDPQERLFLQTVWRLLEQTGYLGENLQRAFDSDVGVYVASMYRPYQGISSNLFQEAVAASSPQSLIPNRVSQFFDFQGPSLALDTMCSSAIVALQTAWHHLRDGQCRAAIVGGVNLSLDVRKYLGLSAGRLIGSHPGSRSFADGDGYLPAEAVGAVLLRPLEDALAAGDDVLATIKGVTTVHTGQSNGLYSPNKPALVRMLNTAYASASVAPGEVDYIESAANGSAQADAIEFSALCDVFGAAKRERPDPIALGAVKSNIGHAEAASGMTQLIKVLLQFKHRRLVPVVKAQQHNSAIDISNSPFELIDECRSWDEHSAAKSVPSVKPRVAGLNALGAGGTYAHLILEEGVGRLRSSVISGRPQLLLLSARKASQLIELASRLRNDLASDHASLDDIAFTLQVCRPHFEERLAILANGRDDAMTKLDQWLANVGGTDGVSVWRNDVSEDTRDFKAMMGGAAGQQHLASLLAQRDLSRLALLWTKGVKFSWMPLHDLTSVRAVATASYPFESERCWPTDPLDHSNLMQSQPEPVQAEQGISARAFICQQIEKRLGTPVTQAHLSRVWVELGLDSIFITGLLRDMEGRFGVTVSHRDLLALASPLELIDHLQSKVGRHPNQIRRASAGQRALAILQQWQPLSTGYNVPIALTWNEVLDEDRFGAAFHALLARHPVLTWSFHFDPADGMCQVTQSMPDMAPIEVLHLSTGSNAPQSNRWQSFIDTPFDLTKGPPIRALLAINEELGQTELLLVIHHAVVDGLSASVVAQELITLYKSPQSPLPSVKGFDAFVDWQEQYVRSDRGQSELAFWLSKLGDLPPTLAWPEPICAQPAGGQLIEVVPDVLSRQIQTRAKAWRTNPSVIFLSAWYVVLASRFSQTDLLVGMPTLGRPSHEFDRSVGYFANTVILREQVSADSSVFQWVRRVANTLAEAMDHADYPYALVHDAVCRASAEVGRPLFDVMYAYQNFADLRGVPSFEGVASVDHVMQQGSHPLALEILPMSQGWRIRLDHQKHVIASEDISEWMQDYLHVLNDLTSDDDSRTLRSLSEAVRHRTFLPLAKRFEHTVTQRGNELALLANHATLTYEQLNRMTDGLAAHLQKLALGASARVGVLMTHRVEAIIAMLACLKAGYTFVPLPGQQPEQRLSLMLHDLAPSLVLTDAGMEGVHVPAHLQRLDISERNWSLSAGDFRSVDIQPDQTAYMIYTSGTTGQPKAVMVSHASLASHVDAIQTVFQYSFCDTALQFAPLHVDAALEQWLVPLLAGAKVYLRPPVVWSVAEFREAVRQHGLTTVDLPPSYLHEVLLQQKECLDNDWFSRLRMIVCGGEPLSVVTAQHWAKGPLSSVKLINAYGPTETTITSTTHELNAPEWTAANTPATVPVGYPLRGEYVYLCDEHGELIQEGVGEIVIAGACVAQGYFQRDTLTQKVFIESPRFHGGLAYRTGDLGCWDDKRRLVCLGRLDDQVKIRGHRVECREVADVLLEHPGVSQAEVIVLNQTERSQLIACLVANQASLTHEDELRVFVQQRLPEPMVPTRFVWFERLPTAVSGKVDRSELTQRVTEQSTGQLDAGLPVADPVDSAQALRAIWQEILGVREIGSSDSFFRLGADSLSVIRLVAAIEQKFSLRWTLSFVREHPTFAQQQACLAGQPEPSSVGLVVLQAGASGEPCIWLPPVSGDVRVYQPLIERLQSDKLHIGLVSDASAGSVQEMAKQAIQSLGKFRRAESLTLIGWSMGGLIALEVARTLVGEGLPPDRVHLSLIDCYPPSMVREWESQTDRAMRSSAVYQRYRQAFEAFEPKPYAGQVSIALAQQSVLALGMQADDVQSIVQHCWKGVLTGSVSASVMPGDHESLLLEPGLVQWFNKQPVKRTTNE